MSKLPTSRLPVTPSKTTNTAKSGLRPPQQTTSQQVSPPGVDASNNPLSIGDRVTANGKIRYCVHLLAQLNLQKVR